MSKKSIKRLLLVEDNLGDARLLREMFSEPSSLKIELAHVKCMSEAEEHLAARAVDIIVLDLALPDAQGLGGVRRAHAVAPRIPLVVLTGLDDESLAIRALQEGAQDYLIKGQIETRGLLRALRYAIERKAMKEALFVEKEHTQATLNSIGDAVVCTDISGNINFFNLVAENMTGWSWQESAGRPMAEVFRILDATSRKTTRNPMEMAVGQNRTEHLPSNCVLLRRDGFEIPIEGSVSRIHDREGHATGAVVVFRDVSAAREMTRQMTHSAQHDVLTDLPNRLLLHDRLTHAIASVLRYRRKLAVLFLDLDSFKHINDSLGHAIGDKLLKTMGERLLAGVRKSDTVSRQGGDEFVVVLSSIGQSEDAALSVTKIISAISAPYSIDQHDLHVGVSVGISIYPDDGVEAEALIQNADNAMYKAKEKGINNYRFFKEEMNVQAVQRQSLEASLRHALERHEFELHYQPKINLQSGQITGVEALIRWRHPERGLIPPGEFIPVAEGCGLIVPIGRWVLLEACRQARAWRDSGLPAVAVAVNVSAIEFLAKDFLSGVRAALIATGVEPRNLELELTETVLMRDAESTVDTLHALKAMGVQLAVDDFGTGYSSFSYLRRFPLDALKIDQSFVHEITGNPDDATIVSAMISIGKNLKQRVIAEGVETRKQLDFLQTQGCGEGQGYYFSRPAVAEQFAKLLETGISETVLN